jgi:hypothetical protein
MHFQNHAVGAIGTLEKIRSQSGIEALKSNFRDAAKTNREKAVSLINTYKLRFSTLYILLPEIVDLNLLDDLSPRSKAALDFCMKIVSGTGLHFGAKNNPPENTDETHTVLKWILLTGYEDDGLNNEFDQIMDAAALVLIRTYHDTAILPKIVHMIFLRNREGYYIHDLVWALFGSCDPKILNLIANHLGSRYKQDVKLANQLLKHTYDDENEDGAQKRQRHTSHNSWFRENRPYLYFTEESFHQTCDPILCSVNLEAKYLCKKTSPQKQLASEPITEDDYSRLESYRLMNSSDKAILAKYSHRLHVSNREQWRKWMKHPIDKQLQIALSKLGGAQ